MEIVSIIYNMIESNFTESRLAKSKCVYLKRFYRMKLPKTIEQPLRVSSILPIFSPSLLLFPCHIFLIHIFLLLLFVK